MALARGPELGADGFASAGEPEGTGKASGTRVIIVCLDGIKRFHRCHPADCGEPSLVLHQFQSLTILDSAPQTLRILRMFAEIHARDDGKKDSEGQTLTMKGVRINTQIREEEGLLIGEPRERFTLVIRGEMQEGMIRRELRLEMNCHEIEAILQAAALGGMMPSTDREKVLRLLSELQTAIATLSGY